MAIEIGISMNYHLSADNIERAYLDHTYFDVFEGYNVLCRPILPVSSDKSLDGYLENISGIVFTGGMDLDTRQWDMPLHAKAELVHARRQEFDLRLLATVIKKKIPILGICLGMQIINMAFGGEICQHIPDINGSVNHGYEGEKTRHMVSLHPESKLRNWLDSETVETASAHHQGIIKAGNGLLAAAETEDGIIEAVEMPGHPFLMAVQWHPEKYIDEPVNKLLIENFIEYSERQGH